MKRFRQRLGATAVLLAGMAVCGVAGATTISMDFDGLSGLASVDTFYNGGCSKFMGVLPANCGGPGAGVVWQGAWTAAQGGTSAYMVPLFTGQATMNVAAGFDTRLSFDFYTVVAGSLLPASVSVYGGLDGGGALLATVSLPSTVWAWQSLDLDFAGTARSAIFTGCRIG